MKRVVVTGMGAITPLGCDVLSFWDGLISGKNGIDRISRFEVSNFKYKLAAEVKDFDAIGILGNTVARKTDLFVQFALCAAQQAMDDSGLENHIESERLGVYFGSGTGGFNTFCNEHAALLAGGPRKVSPLFIPKMISNIAAGNIAIRYKATGPCMSISTACATGTTAIGEAYRAIKHGYATAMICGGSEAAITPLAVAGFGNCMALSASEDKSAASLPFDKRRDGFVMGEGAGALILEEYEHAIARNAPIYAEVCGYGSTCDAYHVTAPDPAAVASARAITDALSDVIIADMHRVYINAHGTGTPLNDKTETASFKRALGEKVKDVHISSTKSMTGHMLCAAGAAEAVAAILALKNGVIPPTINLIVPDEECDLDYTPNAAIRAELDVVLSTSLGFGGHNTCIAFRRIPE